MEFSTQRTRIGFRDTVDWELGGLDKTQRIDIGLAVAHAIRKAGSKWTYQEIAAFCGCTDGFIYQVEKKALRKLRRHAERRLREYFTADLE